MKVTVFDSERAEAVLASETPGRGASRSTPARATRCSCSTIYCAAIAGGRGS